MNSAPVAFPDVFTTPEGVALVVAAPGHLGNDSDPDGDPLTWFAFQVPANGTVTGAMPDGAFTYTPDPGFSGVESFDVTISDGNGNLTDGLVTITVIPSGGNAPVAVADVYTTPEGVPLVVDAPGHLGNDSDPDGDPLTWFAFQVPANGTVTGAMPDGAFTYTPDPGFSGVESFDVTISDGNGNLTDGLVTILVVPEQNRAPIAVPDVYTTPEGVPLVVPAPGHLANDFDPDGDPLTWFAFQVPANGTVTGAMPDGAFTYTPDPGFSGVESFDVTISDGNGNLTDGLVAILVGDVPMDACPTDLVISDFRTAPDAQEFVDLQNVSLTETIDFSTVDCVLGGFTAASYVGLPASGSLLPGETLRFGASATGADVSFPDGTLVDAFAALALLDREDLPNGTSIPTVQPDIVTSLVYLSGSGGEPTVYGFFHVDPANAQLYCTNYTGELHPYGQNQCTATRGTAGGTKNGASEAMDLAAMMEAALTEQARAEVAALPTAFALGSAYPNPLQDRATVGVDVPETAEVRVVVYDVLGRSVVVLFDGPVEAGRHEVTLEAQGLASGTYLVRMTANAFVATRRLTVIR